MRDHAKALVTQKASWDADCLVVSLHAVLSVPCLLQQGRSKENVLAARDSGPQVFVGSELLREGSFCSVGRMDDEGEGTEVTGRQTLHVSYSNLVIHLCSSSCLHGSALCLLCSGKSYTYLPMYHSGLWLHLVFYSHDKALVPSLFSWSLSPLQRRSAFVPCQPSASREGPKPHSPISKWKRPG